MEDFECSDCGATLRSSDEYCPSCGVKFEGNGHSKEDESDLKSDAEKLVGAARIFAISSLVPLLNKNITFKNFFSSNNLLANDWDFFTTVAIVFSGFIQFKESGILENDELFEELIKYELSSWNKLGSKAFDDIVTFFYKNQSIELDDSINIGMWLIWNLKGFEPNNSEAEIANELGNYFLQAFNNWWEQ